MTKKLALSFVAILIAQFTTFSSADILPLWYEASRVDGICEEDAPIYSGTLSAGQGNNYFYFLAESRSTRHAEEPLILWMTGGPGCSSLLAALTENGPCSVVGRDHSGEWRTERRRWSWTDAANVLWVDQPAGVGFSRSSSAGTLANTEQDVADGMHEFLGNFFERYPHLAKVPFFIFGESYAGHYVPAVAVRVLRSGMPLAGVGIGNGLVDALPQYFSKPIMAFTGGPGGSLERGVISKERYEAMEAQMPECLDAIASCQASEERDREQCLRAFVTCNVNEMMPVLQTGRNPYDLRKECISKPLCYNQSLEIQFLNDARVQQRLNVPSRSTVPWAVCNMTVTKQFVLSGDYFLDLRPKIVELLDARVGVLVYSGDDDFMVDWVGTKLWMESLRWPHGEEWKATPEEAFEMARHKRGLVRSDHGLTFMQIYDSGHLVPMNQPEVALEMVRRFVAPSSPWRPRAPAAVELLGGAGGAGEVLSWWLVSLATTAVFAVAALLPEAWRRLRPEARQPHYFLMA